MITQETTTEFWIMSDTHLIADSLHDNGQNFARMQKTSQGKDLYYQEIALRSLVKMAEEKKPAAIIITGDLTFNGELISAKKISAIFSPLKKTKLLVLPGNHDIYDGWARKFSNNKQLRTSQISPYDWKKIFAVSYQESVSQDPSSLAYSVRLNPQYLLILLDSNYYGTKESVGSPVTRGNIKSAELEWLEQELKRAKENNLRPLVFMHHNLYEHNPVVTQGFVLDNAERVRQLLKEYNVKLVFSGHIHAQNIKNADKSASTTEIVTSSFCSFDQGYGVVKLQANEAQYLRKSFTMTPYLTPVEQKNDTLVNFHDYLKKMQLANLAADLLQTDLKKYPDKAELIKKMAKLTAKISFNFFIGCNHLSSSEFKKLKSSPEYEALKKYHPRHFHFITTLFDTTKHSNLETTVKFEGNLDE